MAASPTSSIAIAGATPAEPPARRATPPPLKRAVLSFRRKLVASYSSATIVLLIGAVSFAQIQIAEGKEQRAEGQRRIVSQALEIENAVLSAEMAQRGYLLTRDRRYLEGNAAALPADFDRRLHELLEVARQEPVYMPLVQRVVRNARLKRAEVATSLALVAGGEDPLPYLQLADTHAVSTQLHADAAALTAAVHLERDSETREANLITTFAKWFIAVGNAVAFLLAAAVTFWMGRAFAETERASRDLAEHGRVLEEHARTLAEQEQTLERRLTQERALTRSLERSNLALARSNADLEQFAYVASHDLRAPLRGIASLGDWLEEDLGANMMPETRKHLDALRGRVQRLDALIRGIATYSRTGTRRESLESVDVGKLVRDVVELTVPADSAQVSVQPGFPVVIAPRAPLQQIFLNLISNAVKHGSKRGKARIEIGWADDGDAYRFEVADHGAGIPPEYHQKVFGLFMRLSSRDKVEGTGIGLALVKKLVERHGGRVSLRSTPGAGATFAFTWPKELSDAQAMNP